MAIPINALHVKDAKFALTLRLHNCMDLDMMMPASTLAALLARAQAGLRYEGLPTYEAYETAREQIRRKIVPLSRTSEEDCEQAEVYAMVLLYLIFNIPGRADEIRQQALLNLQTHKQCVITMACDENIAYVLMVSSSPVSEERLKANLALANTSAETRFQGFRVH